MILEAIAAIGGLVVPPAYDFIKKKFLGPNRDTPEATMSGLATTNPEVLPQYVTSMTSYLEAQVKWFNRDVVGNPSQWAVDLRATIRPIVTVLCTAMIIASKSEWLNLDESTLAASWTVVSSWFGDRLTNKA